MTKKEKKLPVKVKWLRLTLLLIGLIGGGTLAFIII